MSNETLVFDKLLIKVQVIHRTLSFQSPSCRMYEYFIFFVAKYYSRYEYTMFYLSISGWTFGLFPLFALVNNDAINICVQVFV